MLRRLVAQQSELTTSEEPRVEAPRERSGEPRRFLGIGGDAWREWGARSWRPAAYYSALALVVVLLWSSYYQRWPGTQSFRTPIAYVESGDVLLVLGISRGFAELPPPWNLHVDHLNAPFGADWNDYPHTEKLIFYVWGMLLRFIDVGVAANLAVLWAHLGSALAFAWTARKLGSSPPVAFVGALIFGFCHFIVGRGLGHVNVGIVWHLPLVLYLVVLLATREQVPSRAGRIAAYLLVIATATQNPYYPPIALQLLALAVFRSWTLRRKTVARFGGMVLLVAAGSFLLGQANVLLHRVTAGQNTVFSGRSLEAIRIWSLRLPDMFMPSVHPIDAWQAFASKNYFNAGNPGSENSFAFLGLVGCVLLVGLAITALMQGMKREFDRVPWQAWVVLYLLMFSLAGGLDYMLGALGVTWLRAVNRYSIIILCAALLWGCTLADQLQRLSVRYGALAVALGITIYEMFGMRPSDHAKITTATTNLVNSDRAFAADLESSLPEGAAVFQIPVLEFPETLGILEMRDCEPFRPYLFSKNLRFSYGTHKGRPREVWQKYAQQLSPNKMLEYLGERGFDALLINRKGLPDRAAWLEGSLAGLGAEKLVESRVGDMVAYRVIKKGSKLPTEFSAVGLEEGFPWGWEEDPNGRWAWSSGDAQLRFQASRTPGTRYRISFSVETLVPRQLEVYIGERAVQRADLRPGEVVSIQLPLLPADRDITVALKTNVPAAVPGNGDPRKMGFRIVDPRATEVLRKRNKR